MEQYYIIDVDGTRKAVKGTRNERTAVRRFARRYLPAAAAVPEYLAAVITLQDTHGPVYSVSCLLYREGTNVQVLDIRPREFWAESKRIIAPNPAEAARIICRRAAAAGHEPPAEIELYEPERVETYRVRREVVE